MVKRLICRLANKYLDTTRTITKQASCRLVEKVIEKVFFIIFGAYMLTILLHGLGRLKMSVLCFEIKLMVGLCVTSSPNIFATRPSVQKKMQKLDSLT